MPQITISKSAIEKISNDQKFRQSREDNASREVPLLYYYRRSYSTSKDGTVIEHGDGFTLSFVNQEEIAETKDIAYEAVAVAGGVNIFVGGPRSLLSRSLNVGLSNAKFTLESQSPSQLPL